MKKVICFIAGLLLWLAVPHFSQAQALSKYQAVFMYNFTRYIEWPTAKQPLVIGVMGNSPVLLELERLTPALAQERKEIEEAQTVSFWPGL